MVIASAFYRKNDRMYVVEIMNNSCLVIFKKTAFNLDNVRRLVKVIYLFYQSTICTFSVKSLLAEYDMLNKL